MRYNVVTIALLLAACEASQPDSQRTEAPPGEPAPAALVSVLSREGPRTLHFELRAPLSHPLYLDNCNGAFSWGLQRYGAEYRAPAWVVATNGCHSSPIVIGPGESRVFSGSVALDPEEHLEAGRYRLAIHGLYSSHTSDNHAENAEVPLESRLSAPFAFGPL